ncbi:hypothetical protein WJ84_01735 [Burkholderia ubonensis]|nr:hypothetical protein WJ84_01735 [Burkholderia ubonensis]KVP39853.1 hypothetical protein WJ87_06630 [Burkholderia ubonensis]
MNLVRTILRIFIAAPVLEHRNGKPVSSFSKFQFWAYPEQCVKQAEEALSHCPPAMQRRQRTLLSAYFGHQF